MHTFMCAKIKTELRLTVTAKIKRCSYSDSHGRRSSVTIK